MNRRMLLNLVTYYREYRGDPAWEAYLTEKQTQRITGIWQADYRGIPIDEWNVVIDGCKVAIYDARDMHETTVHVVPAEGYGGPKSPVPDYTPFGAPEPLKLPPCEDERETDEAKAVDPKLIADVTTNSGYCFAAYRWNDGVELDLGDGRYRFYGHEAHGELGQIIEWLQRVQATFAPAAQEAT